MMGIFSEELNEWDEAFADALEPDAPVPDGTYTAQLITADIVRGTQEMSRLYLSCDFGIQGGPHDGQVAHVLQVLNPDDPKRMTFTKKFLRTLGYDGGNLSGAEAWVPTVLGHTYEIQAKTNGSYHNIYVNRRVPGTAVVDDLPPGDLPF
jgi:hypothetical protein